MFASTLTTMLAIAGSFRPPAVPLIAQSPLINVWSMYDNLNDGGTSAWYGSQAYPGGGDMSSYIKVHEQTYSLMGVPLANGLRAKQLSLVVAATQTHYSFSVGTTGITLNLTFASPLLTEDWDLLSRPAHYMTYSLASTQAYAAGDVSVYLDITGHVVMSSDDATMTFGDVPGIGSSTAGKAKGVHLGADPTAPSYVKPLSESSDQMNWGRAYLIVDAADSVAVNSRAVTQGAFAGNKPPAGNAASPTTLTPTTAHAPASVHVGYDSSGSDLPGMPVSLPAAGGYKGCWAKCNATAACKGWASSAHAGCDGPTISCWLKSVYLPSPPVASACRVYGEQAGPRSDPTDPLTLAATHSFGAIAATPAASTTAPAAPASASASAAAAAAAAAAATTTWRATFAVDEIGGIDWFGEFCPPYWRRAIEPGNLSTPVAMLTQAYEQYDAVVTACDTFDVKTATDLVAAGGEDYAALAQLTYRQVFGAMQLVWMPSKNQAWYFLKEISSCGCLNTADVVYPAFPQLLYYDPELLRLMQISHLEYAMNMTSQPYPLKWAPHHLGTWPVANLPYTGQENMPLEETSWDILSIAAIARRQGNDLTWLTPYWPVIQVWFDFMKDLLPFPEKQLSTDDFDGPLYNATNLAVKGVAAIAAYGYIVETYTGNSTAAAEAYAMAASYANTMVQYSWQNNGTNSHFMIGYLNSQGDGGDVDSWPMLYNALWLKLLGYDNLLPNQTQLLSQMETWYHDNKLQKFGLPLNSRKLYTKDDWMTFLAATFYDDQGMPSAFSSTLFERFYNWADTTNSRSPLSDWTNTDTATIVGFVARPVYGAMWAPMLVHNKDELGLGSNSGSNSGGAADVTKLARAVFDEVHALAAEAQRGVSGSLANDAAAAAAVAAVAADIENGRCQGNGGDKCKLLDAWRAKHGSTVRV